MSLDHVLLGLLREPQSGYAVKQQFDSVFSNFWAAEISQIYRHLKALEKKGLLTSRSEPSDKGPPRKVYETTPAGRDELVGWLVGGPQFADRRVPYLAQTCFLSELPARKDRLGFLQQLRGEVELRLQLLLDIDTELRTEHAEIPGELSDEDVCGQIVLNHGLHRLSALIAWCDESLALLERREPLESALHRTADLLAASQPLHASPSDEQEPS